RVEMLETLLEYQRAKRQLSVVDYADLITLASRLVSTNDAVAETLRARYRVVVLDEYQDTNPAQRILLASLFGQGCSVIAVGDEDQTIYEWRGASAENFQQFTTHFSRPDGGQPHQAELTRNYRSGQVILDVANAIRHQANESSSPLVGAVTDGIVETHWAADAMAEAEWIARRLETLHDDGTPWSEMAVLFRKNKDFPMVVEALARHEIPFEVANLGGLLSVPEVADLRAWLELLAHPEDPGSALHILFGSRYRLGLADIAPVARRIDADRHGFDEDYVGMTLLEALDDLDEITDLRDEARSAYRHFLTLYLKLLSESQGSSLIEIARMVLDETRAWADVEALPPIPRLTARLNLYRFLDMAEDWSPLQGRSSLPAFLDYLHAMEDEPTEELDAARLSGEEAVTLVTVHRAKGLEWEVVAIPAVTHGNFPGTSQMHPDPDKQASVLPTQFRVDSIFRDMPTEPKARLAYLQEKNLNQEWRVAYVAATRAKRHLMFSGAYWYGHPETTQKARTPSVLFNLVDEHPSSVNTGRASEPPRPEILRYEGEAGAPDPNFPDGWIETLRQVIAHPAAAGEIAEASGVSAQFETMEKEWTDRLFALPDELETDEDGQPTTVSVTGLVTYASCPKRFYWGEVDRLPRRRNPAAVHGTEVHRRIELFQKGQVPFEEIAQDIYDVPDAETGPGSYQTFLDSRFAGIDAARVEAPFTLALDRIRVRGRIDAIYVEGSDWEVVDFKSGKPKSDVARMVQLEAYAVACHDIDFGLPRPESMKVTFAYLGGGLKERSTQVDQDWLQAARAHLDDLAEGIERAEHTPIPSDGCRNCDFLRFCGEGQEYLRT
ncbi:MAG: ATP-dependent helicase, partial [Acidimicrobiia bacterium]|nr:ATP-dependent helicase [Acidimicrobiia bacterium]